MLAAIPSRTPKTIRPTLLITRIPYSLSNILAVHHATPTKVVCRAPAVRWLMGPSKTGVGAGPDQVDTLGGGSCRNQETATDLPAVATKRFGQAQAPARAARVSGWNP